MCYNQSKFNTQKTLKKLIVVTQAEKINIDCACGVNTFVVTRNVTNIFKYVRAVFSVYVQPICEQAWSHI